MAKPALAVLLLLATLSAAAARRAEQPPPLPPPGPADRVPLPPVSAVPLDWQPGHWEWRGQTYVWRYGRYVPTAGHGNEWMPGAWVKTEGGWTWVPAHWL